MLIRTLRQTPAPPDRCGAGVPVEYGCVDWFNYDAVRATEAIRDSAGDALQPDRSGSAQSRPASPVQDLEN